jgi:hypothetical protein
VRLEWEVVGVNDPEEWEDLVDELELASEARRSLEGRSVEFGGNESRDKEEVSTRRAGGFFENVWVSVWLGVAPGDEDDVETEDSLALACVSSASPIPSHNFDPSPPSSPPTTTTTSGRLGVGAAVTTLNDPALPRLSSPVPLLSDPLDTEPLTPPPSSVPAFTIPFTLALGHNEEEAVLSVRPVAASTLLPTERERPGA